MTYYPVGAPIPSNTNYAASGSLPKWQNIIDFHKADETFVKQLVGGYPRATIHPKIQQLMKLFEKNYGTESELCLIFPTTKISKYCQEYIEKLSESSIRPQCRILDFSNELNGNNIVQCKVSVLFFPKDEFEIAKSYWKITGNDISARLAEYFLIQTKDIIFPKDDCEQYISYMKKEYDENLDLSFGENSKTVIKRRLSSFFDKNLTNSNDVYLYPTGMSCISNAYKMVQESFNNNTSVCFGFPFADTLRLLKIWSTDLKFYGLGDDKSLIEFENELINGLKVSCLICEIPTNPLLTTPNLKRIKQLSIKFNFVVIIDDTIANSTNINVLPFADLVVTSLTKSFAGSCDVTAGSIILNKSSDFYSAFKNYLDKNFEEMFWAGDAIRLEIYSRNFVERSIRMNENSMKILKLFENSNLIKKIYYPFVLETKKYYDEVKTENGGYGELMSVVFENDSDAINFYDNLKVAKGPSLGTNFTLVVPFALLAHYKELDLINKWEVNKNLVRISIGIEKTDELISIFKDALELITKQSKIV